MENTLENKTKFFTQYWGQNVLRCWVSENDNRLFTIDRQHLSTHDNCWLELKPLSNISDEDAIDILKFMGFDWSNNPIEARSLIITLFVIDSADPLKYEFVLKQMIFKLTDLCTIVDKIRELGYLISYNGISESQIIEWGWVKLKEVSIKDLIYQS